MTSYTDIEHFIFDDVVMFKLKGKRGGYASVSIDKWPAVSEYEWYLGKAGYPICYELKKATLHKFVFYRVIGQWNTNDLYIDHIDRNKLNNTNQNLRLATPQENSFNKTTTTNLKGVTKISENNYTASITKDGIKHEIKNIQTEKEAKECYNMMAEELFGEYASLNKID
jgi:hypothetical protein